MAASSSPTPTFRLAPGLRGQALLETPAMGLAVSATRARHVTDGMFLAAAHALAERSPALTDAAAPLLPALTDLCGAAIEIAMAAAEQGQREGLAPRTSPESLRNSIVSSQWAPHYPSYL